MSIRRTQTDTRTLRTIKIKARNGGTSPSGLPVNPESFYPKINTMRHSTLNTVTNKSITERECMWQRVLSIETRVWTRAIWIFQPWNQMQVEEGEKKVWKFVKVSTRALNSSFKACKLDDKSSFETQRTRWRRDVPRGYTMAQNRWNRKDTRKRRHRFYRERSGGTKEAKAKSKSIKE